MATAQLATQGYRIAKSWQYQENLPDPTQATSVAGSGQESPRDNNNSFFVSSSLNHQRSATANEKFDSGKNPKKFLGIFPCRTRDGDRDDPNLRRPLILTGQQESRQTDDGHRKDEDDKMSGGALCCLTLLVLIAQIFLHGVVGLVLYWVIRFHTTDGASFPFAWRDDPVKEFNLHPVLMIVGLIYFSGQAILFYRSCRCCRRIWSKLFHAMFHLLAIPCVVIGFLAVLDSHNLRVDQDGKPSPIPNFYSLHSWMGATTMGLFAIQYIAGFFSFLLLLCCESATASFRASLVPVHSAFGLTTFVLAVATACTGLTEKAFFTLSIAYTKWVPYLLDPRFNTSAAFAGINTLGPAYTADMFEQSLVINVLGACLIGLVIVMPVIVMNPPWRFRPQRVITVTHDRYE